MPGGNLTRCTYMLPGLDGLPWRTATWMPTPRGLFHSTSSGVKRTNPFSSFSADAESPITASPAIALTAQMNCHLTFMLSSDASFIRALYLDRPLLDRLAFLPNIEATVTELIRFGSLRDCREI